MDRMKLYDVELHSSRWKMVGWLWINIRNLSQPISSYWSP